jgi:hypothetical protein
LLLKLAVYGIKEKHIMQASGRRNPYTVSIQYSVDTILRADNDFHDLLEHAVDKYTGPLEHAVDKYTGPITHYKRFHFKKHHRLLKLYGTLMNKFIHSIEKKKSDKEKSDKQKSDKEKSDEERSDEEGSDEERSDEETSQLCYDLAGNKDLFRIFFLQILVHCLEGTHVLYDFDLMNIGTYLIPELSDFSVYVGAHQTTTDDGTTIDDVCFIQFKIPLKCKKEWMDFFVGTTLAEPQVIQVESRINNNDPFKNLGCWDPEALEWTKTLDVIGEVFGEKQGDETDKDSYFPTQMGNYKKLHIELQQSDGKNIDEYWFSALKDVFGMYSHRFQEIQGNHDFHTHPHAISQFVRAFAQNALKLSLPKSNARVKYEVPDPSPNQETQHATQMRVKIGQTHDMTLTDWHLSFVVKGSNITITYQGLEIPYIAPKKKWLTQRTDSLMSAVFFMYQIIGRLEHETKKLWHDPLPLFLYLQVRGKKTTVDQRIATVHSLTEKLPSPLSVLLFKKEVKDLLTKDSANILNMQHQWIRFLQFLGQISNRIYTSQISNRIYAKFPTEFIDQGINDVVQFLTEGLGPDSGTKIDIDRWYRMCTVINTVNERLKGEDGSSESSLRDGDGHGSGGAGREGGGGDDHGQEGGGGDDHVREGGGGDDHVREGGGGADGLLDFIDEVRRGLANNDNNPHETQVEVAHETQAYAEAEQRASETRAAEAAARANASGSASQNAPVRESHWERAKRVVTGGKKKKR